MKTKRPRLLKVLSFWLGVLVLLGLCAEGALRYRGFRFDPYRYYKRFGANFEADEIRYYEGDAALFWRFRPSNVIHDFWVSTATINSEGFRGPEFRWSKKPGTFRVVCLGDSGTFGWNVGDDEGYPARLEALLTQAMPGRRVEVVNMGVPGYSSYQGRRLVEADVVRMSPDVIVFSYGRNDHNDTVYLTDRQRRRRPAALVDLQDVLLESRLYQWAFMKVAVRMYKTTVHEFVVNGPKQAVRVPLDDYEDNLRSAAAAARRLGARILFLPRAQWPQYNETMRRVAGQTGAGYVDLSLQKGDRELIDFMHGEHPGPDAYRRLAGIIASRIMRPNE